MTAALAKAMGVPVGFQSVYVDESWSRSGDLYVASGHVNLTLGRPSWPGRTMGDNSAVMVVDFLPASELRGQRSRPLDESTIVAMFMNNRAAETLTQGDTDGAYWWVREALRQDGRLPAAYNTLGVVYLRRGQPQRAQAALEEALRLDPDNTRALANLLPALKAQGQTEATAAAAAQLARLEATPPFHWFNAGLAAMRDRDYRQARELFSRELERDADYHEIHYWLAQAEAGLGNLSRAREHLERAAQTATLGKDQALYAGKLDRLRAHGLAEQAQ
jgi:Tfp pilus assembly protein PilF